uniref:Uncharacterized protein n=1 Tax=virus sp. ctML55 TaxID=2827627 RepID=A0A8S5RIE9_9VIRU|nr:MAG TPA: hypothetical protein [virus sp. ctML55]DAW92012.1 MAG TPA: hypothetical protein [Bacteriophage sp.]
MLYTIVPVAILMYLSYFVIIWISIMKLSQLYFSSFFFNIHLSIFISRIRLSFKPVNFIF